MAKMFNDWLLEASVNRRHLDIAITENDQKGIIYYRGRYLHALKSAYKLDSSGIVPPSVSGKSSPNPLQNEIRDQLNAHQAQIDASLIQNKKTSDISKPTFSTELGLKLRRISTRASQVDFASDTIKPSTIVRDSLGIAGTIAKAPLMITSKVVSKVGPLAITILTIPFTFVASGLSLMSQIDSGKTTDDWYKNTPVHKMTAALKDGIKDLSNITYKQMGKI